MTWWEITLIVIGGVIGAVCAFIVGFMILLGWRLSNRGPF